MDASQGENWPLFNKVPEVTLSFWIIKIMCTTVGEMERIFWRSMRAWARA